MERKLSSNSEQSHSSSVVIQPHLSGLGTRVIENIIKDGNEQQQQQLQHHQHHQAEILNTQDIYEQQKLKNSDKFIVSTFDNNYNDLNLKYHHSQHSPQQQQQPQPSQPSHSHKQRLKLTSPLSQLDDDDEFNETIDLDKSISGIIDIDLDEEQLEDGYDYNYDEQELEREHDQPYPQDEDEELMNYLDSDYEPASPPRSPPRDLDTDKLYGLYEFSGPDPSHCSLQVDEPVYLINDQDSYWWLIKKLSKDEKKERLRRLELEHSDVESDEEDGKVGFVPAECLETHGERLARLNCFKNEELEKFNLSREESIVSLKKSSPTTNNAAKKSVTFENLGDIIDEYSDEEPKDDHESIRQNLEFYNDLGAIQPLHPQQPEVLSDVYPTDAPLVVPKNNKNVLSPPPTSSNNQPTITPTLQSSNMFEDLFVKPRKQNPTASDYDDVSIGSFSPDTPIKGKSPLRTEIGDDDELDQVARNGSLSSLRRSVILDRLTQVTSDIQEQLRLEDGEEQEEDEESEEEEEGDVKLREKSPSVDSEESDDEDEVQGFSFDDSMDSQIRSKDRSINSETSSNNHSPAQLKESDRLINHTPVQTHQNDSPEQIKRTPSSEQTQRTSSTSSNNSQRTPSISSNHSQRTPSTSSNHSQHTPSSSSSTSSHHSQRSATSEQLHRTPSQDRVRSTTPVPMNNTPREESQFTPTQKCLSQQGGSNMSPALQKLLHTPSNSQPPVSQIPTPNSLRSTPTQSYSISELSYNRIPKSSTSIDDEEEEPSSSEENNHDDSITPLTSMNSLTPIDERRKLKPVHEMFMPILGKFDELAEKLAELDDILK
ncbi:Bud site selection protein 14 [Candida viswanathii]|uniref:Bud site selection protein 14 n=1 Tax=Candida viswanathii TaxID=5486 RepID=A0A367YQG2_9ASCO|nr:Bud site selection protein 14 [Candida viswanathii]